MSGRPGVARAGAALLAAVVVATLAACRKEKTPAARSSAADLPPVQRDAELLGQEVFSMVDRAIDYRGSHRGRPANSLRQLGIDSLTPTMVRRLINVDRDPVVTVAYRQSAQREIVACRGDSQILEEAAVNGGRFTVMCENATGMQRPIQVGSLTSP